MTMLLIKKEFQEFFRALFIDQRKGKKRSIVSTIMYIFIYIFAFGSIGSMFGVYALLICEPIVEANLDWLYFVYLSISAVGLGIIGSVFSTYSALYKAKDIETLLSLPIKTISIVVSKIVSVYIVGTIFVLLAMVPSCYIYFKTATLTTGKIVGPIVLTFVDSLIVFVLTIVFGWLLGAITKKIKNKSFFTVALSLGFIFGYYWFVFKLESIIGEFLNHIILYAHSMQKKAPLLYWYGQVAEGKLMPSIILIAAMLFLCAIVIYFISKTFIKIATAKSGVDKKEYKDSVLKSYSLDKTLFSKELAMLTSKPAYILNCGLGVVMILGASIYMVIAPDKITTSIAFVEEIFLKDLTDVGIIAALMMCSISTYFTAPSVSLESKNLWIAQSLPITGWQMLKGKLNLHIILTAIPSAIMGIVAAIICGRELPVRIFCIIVPVLTAVLAGEFGLFANLIKPDMNWTSEIVVIKQSFSVFISLFGGWGFVAGVIAIKALLFEEMASVLYLTFIIVIIIAIILVLYCWLKKKGSHIIENL